MRRWAGRVDRGRAAFTLIEMLAVVLIFALVAAFVAPNVGLLRSRALRQEAKRISAQLELARQRSVMTGIPHRVLFDLDAGVYRVEWLGPPADDEALAPELDLARRSALPLAAPRYDLRQFEPLPGVFGHFAELEQDVFFSGLETADGWIARGESWVEFDRDGTTTYTEVVLDDGEGRTLVLEILPLADAVRVRDDDAA